MTNYRLGAIALIVGSLGGVVTMALHPTGHDFSDPKNVDSAARLAVAVHALAVASMPLLFIGTLALSRHLASPSGLSSAALVLYGYSIVAVMFAAVAGGFIAPDLIREVRSTTPPESETWHIVLDYNFHLNQAFAKVFSAASAIAIAVWSLEIVRRRALAPALGICGLVFGPVAFLGVVSGHVRMNVHGEGALILGESIWFVIAAVQLWRASARLPDATSDPRVTRTS